MNIIILSYTKDYQYFCMLRDCINSIGPGHDVIVVETNSKLKNKNIDLPCRFVFPEEEFNYNRFLNKGFESLKNKNKVIISNNDVIYSNDCLQKLEESLDVYDSVSPCESYQSTEVGSEVGKHVKGWCIGLNYNVYEKMGKWDESFKFWYQDNDYCNFLKMNNFTHAVIGNAIAKHLVSRSHYLLDDIQEFTNNQINVLKDKWVSLGIE